MRTRNPPMFTSELRKMSRWSRWKEAVDGFTSGMDRCDRSRALKPAFKQAAQLKSIARQMLRLRGV
jgi:hypothetical protein